MTRPPATRVVGDRALLVEVADPAAAQRLFRAARRLVGTELVDVVPGHDTVLLVGREAVPSLEDLEADDGDPDARPRTVTIEVRYDGEDLRAVADATGLALDEVVRRHAQAAYSVAFLGFAPGFPYLVGGDPALMLPRRASPRTRVPAGAVAIAGEYTAIYPRASPGGWHLLGRTDAVLFDPASTPPALLAPGDAVRLVVRP